MATVSVPVRGGVTTVAIADEAEPGAFDLLEASPSAPPAAESTADEARWFVGHARDHDGDIEIGIGRDVYLWLPTDWDEEQRNQQAAVLGVEILQEVLPERGLVLGKLVSDRPFAEAMEEFTRQVSASEHVAAEIDYLGELVTPEDEPAPESEPPEDNWHLTREEIPEVWKHLGRGSGVKIGVVDTWFNTAHTAFDDKVDCHSATIGDAPHVLPLAETVEGETEGMDLQVQGHGTWCAGVAAAHDHLADPDSPYSGVAPEADLLLVRLPVTTLYGSRWTRISRVARAIVYASTYADVVSISFRFRGPMGPGWGESLSEQLEAAVWARGGSVPIFCSAGLRRSVSLRNFPLARHYETFAIGASGVSEEKYSGNRGRELELLAPGERIVTPDAGSERGTSRHQGTSMATPWVAGLAALLIGFRRAQGAELPRSELIELLRRASTKYHQPTDVLGYGKVQAREAARLAVDSILPAS